LVSDLKFRRTAASYLKDEPRKSKNNNSISEMDINIMEIYGWTF